jgi:hypothetical protein
MKDETTVTHGRSRFTQNPRRVLGYDVQYFATIEPQRRLAPHVHVAMRGTISRAGCVTSTCRSAARADHYGCRRALRLLPALLPWL